MENPVYYVQYAHARICSVMRKAAERGISIPDSASAELIAPLESTEELGLLQLADQLEHVVDTSARQLAPHHISFYLQELASALHRFYASTPILNADDNLVTARLLLLRSIAQVLRNGLDLLAVSAPETM